MNLALRFGTLFAFVFCSPWALAASPTADDYVGKWDLMLADSGTTFRACSLKLERRDDHFAGEMVWRWGSVWKFDKPGTAKLNEKGELLIENPELWKEPLVLRRIGADLEGRSVEKNGKTFKILGFRSVRVIDFHGTWDVTVHFDAERSETGQLELSHVGAGRYEAKGVNAHGKELDITQLAARGENLHLQFRGKDGEELELKAEAKGDRMAGVVRRVGDGGELKISGKRRRRFGPPVKLLAENGTTGWRPRDESRAFKWTCSDGVLTNGKHDVDIVSDQEFKDFKLKLQYKVDKLGSNSGIYVRGRYEVQIIGNKKLHPHGNGAVYSRLSPTVNPFSGVGEWQDVEIVVIGRYLTVTMNGTVVHDNALLDGITGGALRSFEHEVGPIMLQGDHGKIYFRNVEVYPALP